MAIKIEITEEIQTVKKVSWLIRQRRFWALTFGFLGSLLTMYGLPEYGAVCAAISGAFAGRSLQKPKP